MIYDLGSDYFVRALLEDDLQGPYLSWFQDQQVTKYSSHGKLFKQKKYYEDYLRSISSSNDVLWAICHSVDGHIGNASLQNLSFINRSAEFAILLGDDRHWGRGVAKKVATQLFHHGFFKLNLHSIYCGAASTNDSMCFLAGSLGMLLEGRRKEQLWLEGAWVDILEFGITFEDFFMRSDPNDLEVK